MASARAFLLLMTACRHSRLPPPPAGEVSVLIHRRKQSKSTHKNTDHVRPALISGHILLVANPEPLKPGECMAP